MRNLAAGAFAALVALILGYGAPFSVRQTEQVLVVRLGKPIRVVTKPGLSFKFPLLDSIIRIDNRILDLENLQQEVIASDQTRLVVDAFARYRIGDALRFYQTVGAVRDANARLSILLNSALRRVFGAAIATDIVRDKRPELMTLVREQLEDEARAFGISVVDVRIRRANLPTQNSQAVYQRMQTERQRQAAGFRAEGSQHAQEIRAKADRQATVLVAQATSTGEQVRGDGDAARNRLYAAAYERDPDFFAFYRTMQAYENAFPAGNTGMLLKTNSQFFRFFDDPHGKARGPKEPR